MALSKNYLIILVTLFVAIGIFLGTQLRETKTIQDITSFEACAQAGYPIMETYPEQCRTPGGRTFVKEISNQQITVTGESVCLPHKEQGEFQTLECAYGIKATNGNYYGLRDPEMKYMSSLATGETVTVSGIITSAPETNYDIVGIIEVQSLSTQ